MSALKYLANKKTGGTFLLLFRYFGAIGEPLNTPPWSGLMDAGGNKHSQSVRTVYYPENIPESF